MGKRELVTICVLSARILATETGWRDLCQAPRAGRQTEGARGGHCDCHKGLPGNGRRPADPTRYAGATGL